MAMPGSISERAANLDAWPVRLLSTEKFRCRRARQDSAGLAIFRLMLRVSRAYRIPPCMAAGGETDLWVGLWSAGELLKINAAANKMTAYMTPSSSSGAYSVSVDKKNNIIWVSLQQVDKLASFNPKTGEWAEYPLPESES